MELDEKQIELEEEKEDNMSVKINVTSEYKEYTIIQFSFKWFQKVDGVGRIAYDDTKYYNLDQESTFIIDHPLRFIYKLEVYIFEEDHSGYVFEFNDIFVTNKTLNINIRKGNKYPRMKVNKKDPTQREIAHIPLIESCCVIV